MGAAHKQMCFDKKLADNMHEMRFVKAMQKAIHINDIVKVGIHYTHRRSPRTAYRIGRVVQNTDHVLILRDARGIQQAVNWQSVVCKHVSILKVYKNREVAS